MNLSSDLPDKIMIVIIAYDIASDKRRNRIHKALKGYGVNSQLSIFECDIQPTKFKGLIAMLELMINKEEDDLRIYRLCADCKENIITMGTGKFCVGDEIIVI